MNTYFKATLSLTVATRADSDTPDLLNPNTLMSGGGRDNVRACLHYDISQE